MTRQEKIKSSIHLGWYMWGLSVFYKHFMAPNLYSNNPIFLKLTDILECFI